MQQTRPVYPALPYRPDIDGLRGLSVLFVVGYHAFPEWLRGGFVGVDVFFVISGYLITHIVLASIASARWSLANFYRRRVARLFPAMLVVLACSMVLGWFALYAAEYRQLGKHAAGGAGFLANWIFWSEAGYFDNSAATKPLLHLWSLAVEEQFYLLWPVALWLLVRTRMPLGGWLAGGVLLSFATGVWLTHVDPATAFFVSHARFWELGIGALLAHRQAVGRPAGPNFAGGIPLSCPMPAAKTMTNIASGLGLGLIVSSVAWFTGDVPYPGWRALLPVLGAVLVIAAGPAAWPNRALLSHPWLVWTGLVSFPLYLWHWPTLSFAHIVNAGVPHASVRAILVVLSGGLAWITYRWVEMPLRHGIADRYRLPALVSAMALAGGVGLAVFWLEGVPQRFPNASLLEQRMADWDYPSPGMVRTEVQGVPVHRVGGHGPTTLFFGDSNVEQYGPRISALLHDQDGSGRSALFLTQGGAAPIDRITRNDGFTTSTDNFMKVAAHPQVDRVVIAAAWSLYFYGDKAGLGLSGPLLPRYFADGESLEHPPGQRLAVQRLAEMVGQLVQQGKHVYLVDGIPAGKEFLAATRTSPRRLFLQDTALNEVLQTAPLAQVQQRLEAGTAVLTRVATLTGATLIRPLKTLCPADSCTTVQHKDAGHLRASFVRASVDYLDVTVAP